MLSLSPSVRILVCLTSVDCRKSFDGLAALVRQALGDDPLSGHWFVFRNSAHARPRMGIAGRLPLFHYTPFVFLLDRGKSPTYHPPNNSEYQWLSIRAAFPETSTRR